MAELSALNTDWIPRVAVAIRGYYDKSGELAEGRVTLAGYAAPLSVWTGFEKRWLDVLANAPIQPCRYLHMVKAMHLSDGFQDWSRSRVAALLREFFNRCFSPDGWGEGEEALSGVHCTIERSDYDRACQVLPHLRQKGWAAVCADYVAYVALTLLPQDPDKSEGHRKGTVELYFDRDEPFQKEIESAWNKALNRPSGRRGPLSMVSHIGAVEMKKTPAVQAADYLAWHVNRWYTRGCRRSNFMAVLAAQGVGDRFGYDKLVDWYRDGPDPLHLMPTPPVDPPPSKASG